MERQYLWLSRTASFRLAEPSSLNQPPQPVPGPSPYARLVRPRLEEALADTPAVLVHGPRQSGKTTLARDVGDAAGYGYVTFDDDTTRAAAEADAIGFVDALPDRVVLDEVQRVPALFTSLKAAIDRDRTPGRFLLTGSANVLLVPRLADSLAGRMETIRLHPLSQAELAGISDPARTFLARLVAGILPASTGDRLAEALAARVAAGGFPAALARSTGRRRAAWYRDYVDTIVQRDVRDLSRIRSLDVLPRLLAVAASQTSRLLNVTDLAGPFQLTQPTIRDYVTLLERVFLLDEIPPWHSNRLSRLVKAARLHMGDTGLACALLGVDAEALWADRPLYGQMLETFVVQELRRLASGYEDPVAFHHLRDRDGTEVDVVLEVGGRRIVGVEVKAAASVRTSDFAGLRKLRDAAGERFVAGVVLYDGEATHSFGDALWAVPIRCLWEPS